MSIFVGCQRYSLHNDFITDVDSSIFSTPLLSKLKLFSTAKQVNRIDKIVKYRFCLGFTELKMTLWSRHNTQAWSTDEKSLAKDSARRTMKTCLTMIRGQKKGGEKNEEKKQVLGARNIGHDAAITCIHTFPEQPYFLLLGGHMESLFMSTSYSFRVEARIHVKRQLAQAIFKISFKKVTPFVSKLISNNS